MAKQPVYKTIQNDIVQKIASGELAPGAKLPTENDLMGQYGVSRITVQHALNELKAQGVLVRRPRSGTFVRKAVAERPREAVRPVYPARERLSLGVVASFDMANASAYRYLNGIMSALELPRDSIRLHNTGDEAVHERMMLENCIEDGCDGILYYPGREPAPPFDLLSQIAEQGFPCVLIDKQIYGVPLPCVQTDNVGAGRAITQELINHGHRNIAFLLGGLESSVRERYIGFCQAMSQAGLGTFRRVCYNVWDYIHAGKTTADLVADILAAGFTAVCCSADLHAGWVREACRDMGIDVPGRLAIGSIDGSLPGDITSMLQPYEQIGKIATETLLKWILNDQVDRKTISLPATLLRGRTL